MSIHSRFPNRYIRRQRHMRGALSQLPTASGPWISCPAEESRRPAQMSLFEGLQP